MPEYWDDDWDYMLNLWVDTEKSFLEFKDSLQKIVQVPIVDNQFQIGAIECEVVDLGKWNEEPKFEGVPEGKYLYMVNIPITTSLIWSAIDKPFAAGLFVSMKTTFRCCTLLTADSEFFVAFTGTNKPFVINKRYRPWSEELSAFVKGQNVKEVTLY